MSLSSIASGIAALVIILAVIVIVLGNFQSEAQNTINSLNNTDAQNTADTTFRMSWTGLRLLAIGILAVVGFAIVKILRD